MAKCKACNREMTTAKGCVVTHYNDFGDGKKYERIPYEGDFNSSRCHDCGCKSGELHHVGCDMEKCPKCKGQCISCDCPKA